MHFFCELIIQNISTLGLKICCLQMECSRVLGQLAQEKVRQRKRRRKYGSAIAQSGETSYVTCDAKKGTEYISCKLQAVCSALLHVQSASLPVLSSHFRPHITVHLAGQQIRRFGLACRSARPAVACVRAFAHFGGPQTDPQQKRPGRRGGRAGFGLQRAR